MTLRAKRSLRDRPEPQKRSSKKIKQTQIGSFFFNPPIPATETTPIPRKETPPKPTKEATPTPAKESTPTPTPRVSTKSHPLHVPSALGFYLGFDTSQRTVVCFIPFNHFYFGNSHTINTCLVSDTMVESTQKKTKNNHCTAGIWFICFTNTSRFRRHCFWFTCKRRPSVTSSLAFVVVQCSIGHVSHPSTPQWFSHEKCTTMGIMLQRQYRSGEQHNFTTNVPSFSILVRNVICQSRLAQRWNWLATMSWCFFWLFVYSKI